MNPGDNELLQMRQYATDELDLCQPIKQLKNKIQRLEEQHEQVQEKLRNEHSKKCYKSVTQISINNSNNQSILYSQYGREKKEETEKKELSVILTSENRNLKDQNQYLLEKIRKMYQKEKKYTQLEGKKDKYKAKYRKAYEQLNKVKQQSLFYLQQFEKVKKIALYRIQQLQMAAQVRDDDFEYGQLDSESLNSQNFTSHGTKCTKIPNQDNTDEVPSLE